VLPVRRQAGFSLIELVVAVLVAVILLAVALPMFLRAYRSYQLTNASRQVADILRLTRYQAIRLNKPVNCVFQPYSGDSTMTSASMTDASGNSLTGIGTGTTVLLGLNGNLVDAGSVPGGGALPGSANLGSTVPVRRARVGDLPVRGERLLSGEPGGTRCWLSRGGADALGFDGDLEYRFLGKPAGTEVGFLH
jgi:prepilin-type N-terminal cleavage/methylation domain-containing protein